MSAADPDPDPVLISLGASPARRWFAVVAISGLGIFLISMVFQPLPGPWRAVLLLAGGGALRGAERLFRATGEQLELTARVLRMSGGRILTPVANVRSVERGVLAFKPSNGFVAHLVAPSGRGWVPGLWWQWGRIIGVGGVVRGSEARAMADQLAVLCREAGPGT